MEIAECYKGSYYTDPSLSFNLTGEQTMYERGTGTFATEDKSKFRHSSDYRISREEKGFTVQPTNSAYSARASAFTTLGEALKFIKDELSKPTREEWQAAEHAKQVKTQEREELKRLQKKYK